MATNQDKLGSIVKALDQNAGLSPKEGDTLTGDRVEVKNTLGFAYQAYIEERRNLAQAFKERGQRDQEAYKEAELRYRACEEAIDKAMKVRERAEIYASDMYREEIAKGVDNASRVYKDKTKQVMTDCKQQVMEAWRSSTETSTPMTSVCEEAIDKAMKAREKAELDALDAYRDDVDKAVEKASRAYKERMKQALTECMQRVMNAWITSMDTSVQMTGVFAEDGNIRDEARRPEKKSLSYKLQIQAAIVHIQRKLVYNSQRALRILKIRRYA